MFNNENTYPQMRGINFRPEDSIDGYPWFTDPSIEMASYIDPKLHAWTETARILVMLALDNDKRDPVVNQSNWEIITDLGLDRYKHIKQSKLKMFRRP